MTEVKNQRPHYTYSDYLWWEGQWELIGGLPYAMRPHGSLHALTTSRLSYIFIDAIKKSGCSGYDIIGRFDWKITEDIVVQPDLVITSKPISNDNYLDFAPELVVEVCSQLTGQKDREIKTGIYLEQKVKYYLIIDPAKRTNEVLQINNDEYIQVALNHRHFIFDISECSINVAFATLFKP